MFANLTTGTQFECPWCGQGLEIDSWDTEYGDPIYGDNNVTCVKCRKEIGIRVYVEITVQTKSIAGLPEYKESYEFKKAKSPPQPL